MSITTSRDARQMVAVQATNCACAHHRDGSTTAMLCPVHADNDPCATFAQVTGKRRKGTIRAGKCSRCGWSEAASVARHEREVGR